MKVEQILNSKGSSVISVSSDADISEAVDLLGKKNIGAVVVKNQSDGVCGILSERDIVRRLSKEGPDVLAKKVSGCMTPDPFTCERSATIDEVMTTMTEKRIRHMPIVEGGMLIGVVSIGDVVKWKIETAEQEAANLRDYIAS